MLLDLMDILRCPVPHQDSWLVLSADGWEGRHVTAGTLGCPACRAEFPIAGGVADLSAGVPVPRDAGGEDGETGDTDPERAVRLAALLDLGEPGGVVLLAGRLAALAPVLEELVPATYVLLNAAVPPPGPASASGVAASTIPFAAGSLRGVALDQAHGTTAFLAGAVRALRTGGRLVAPEAVPVPAGLEVLARDAREWVGIAEGPPGAVVSLRRGGRG